MKERPILFSAPMVRAILEGRKTQTRRIVKHPIESHPVRHMEGGAFFKCVNGEEWWVKFPYGKPGDRLWVRETWRAFKDNSLYEEPGTEVDYRATPASWAKGSDAPWKPSIHMPRWASRINLEITAVRVERLQDISAKDIIAEGAVDRPHVDRFGRNPVSAFDGKVYLDLLSLWAAGWESINGPGSWGANPWVWVVEFKRLP